MALNELILTININIFKRYNGLRTALAHYHGDTVDMFDTFDEANDTWIRALDNKISEI